MTHCPRYWGVECSFSALHDIEDREPAAALDNPGHLAKRTRLILKIHANVNHIGVVKRSRIKRHFQGRGEIVRAG